MREALPEADTLPAAWSGFFVETSKSVPRERSAAAGEPRAYSGLLRTSRLRRGIAPVAIFAAVFGMRGTPGAGPTFHNVSPPLVRQALAPVVPRATSPSRQDDVSPLVRQALAPVVRQAPAPVVRQAPRAGTSADTGLRPPTDTTSMPPVTPTAAAPAAGVAMPSAHGHSRSPSAPAPSVATGDAPRRRKPVTRIDSAGF